MKRALVVLACLVVALLLLAVAAASRFLDADAIKARLAAEVRRSTGRELQVAGPVRLAWSLTPTLELNDVSLGNPPGFPQPQMAHLASARARLALLPLLHRRVVVDQVAVAAPDIRLERNAAGEGNWHFAPPPAPAPANASAPSAPHTPWLFEIGPIAVTDAVLHAGTTVVSVPRATFEQAGGHVDAIVRYGGQDVAVAGTVGPGLDLRLTGPGFTGSVAGAPAALKVSLHAADLAALSPLAGRPLPPARDLEAAGTVSVTPGRVGVTGLQLTSQAGDLSGQVAWSGGPHPSLDGALASRRLDLDALMPAQPKPAAPAPVATAPSPNPAPAPVPAETRVIPDIPLPLDALRRGNADLLVSFGSVKFGGRTFDAVQAHAVLANATLRVDPASLAVGGAVARGTLQVDAASASPGVHLSVDAPGLPLGGVAAMWGGAADVSGTLDVRADLTGSGGTLRALAATLAGPVGLALVDGRIGNAVLDRLVAAPLRTMGVSVETGGHTDVRCAALRADATGGVLHVSTLALDTAKLALEGSGDVDLGRETLDLHLRPQLRLGGGLSVPLLVRGTLAAPKAALDPGAIASGRVGLLLGGPPPPDMCGPALAVARDGQPGAPAAAAPPARASKPADFLRGLLR